MKATRILGAGCLLAAVTLWQRPLCASSCYSDLSIVRNVNPAHLVRQARAVRKQLAALGAALDRWELDALDRAILAPHDPLSVGTIQQVLDAHVLVSLSLSSEGGLKAAPGPAHPNLAVGGWGTFLIKVDNLGRTPSQLRMESPHALAAGEREGAERWARFELWPPEARLSGQRLDYYLLRVQGQQAGRREALLVFSTSARGSQPPGPLSFNRVPILFALMDQRQLATTRLAHLLRHQHNGPYLAVPQRRGPSLATVRLASCLACHDTAQETQASPTQLARERSCLACHRQLEPRPALASERCPVCGMENCRMGCVARGRTSAGQEVMRMGGIPRSLFLGGVGVVLVASFGLVEYLGRRGHGSRSRRWNLLAWPALSWCARQRWFRPLLQVPTFLVFCGLVFAGFQGDQTVNIAPVLTWTIWWAGLVFLVLLLGKAWCYVCPWDFAATLAQNLGRLWGAKRTLTLGLRWPRGLRNIYLAIGLFVLLTWLELGYQVTALPRATAGLALLMVALSVVPALLFDKRSYCRYGCLVGRISGLYALFAPLEVRCKDPQLCRQCRGHECFRGDQQVPPCPTSLLLPTLQENTYCIQCGYCLRSCPSDNVALNVRPFAADLTEFTHPRSDESLLAIILLALTSFHGLTMTPLWDSTEQLSVLGGIGQTLGTGRLAAFTIGMALIVAAPIGAFAALCALARWWVGEPAVSWRKLFVYYAYALLPVALFYHLAHSGMHLVMEGQYLWPLLSDPLGRGWDLFGTATSRPGPLLSAQAVWWWQVGLVIVGHISGIVVAHHASQRLYRDRRQATRSLVPMLAGMVLYSWGSLWLLHLDMHMRSSLL